MGQGIISRSNPGNTGDKVGDIKITTRNTLGDKWALCNGDPVPEGSLFTNPMPPNPTINQNDEWINYPNLVDGFIKKEFYKSESNVYCAYISSGEASDDGNYTTTSIPVFLTIDKFIGGNPDEYVRVLDKYSIGSEIVTYFGDSCIASPYIGGTISHGDTKLCFGFNENNNKAIVGYTYIDTTAWFEMYSSTYGTARSCFRIVGIDITNNISRGIDTVFGDCIDECLMTDAVTKLYIDRSAFKYIASGTSIMYAAVLAGHRDLGDTQANANYTWVRGYCYNDNTISCKLNYTSSENGSDFDYTTSNDIIINNNFYKLAIPFGDSGTIVSFLDLENSGKYCICSAYVEDNQSMIPMSDKLSDIFCNSMSSVYGFYTEIVGAYRYNYSTDSMNIVYLHQGTPFSINAVKLTLNSTSTLIDDINDIEYTGGIYGGNDSTDGFIFPGDNYTSFDQLHILQIDSDIYVFGYINGWSTKVYYIFKECELSELINRLSSEGCHFEIIDSIMVDYGRGISHINSNTSYFSYDSFLEVNTNKAWNKSVLPTISVDDESYCFIKIKD